MRTVCVDGTGSFMFSNLRRERLIMFKTRYSGQVQRIGSGRLVSNWFTRRSYITVGEKKLRNVMASDDLDDFVEASVEDGDEVTLNVGWVMFYRWLLSAKNPADHVRQGLILLIAGMMTHIFVIGVVGLLAGAIGAEVLPGYIGPLLGAAIIGFGLLTVVLNLKAWLGG